MEVMEQGHIKVIKEHPFLLDTLDKYEQLLTKLQGGRGHSLKNDANNSRYTQTGKIYELKGPML